MIYGELCRTEVSNTIHAYDRTRNLLTVWFPGSCDTLVVDCKKRKIVAHYESFRHGQIAGCLIDDTFWMVTTNGVKKLPFPSMDVSRQDA